MTILPYVAGNPKYSTAVMPSQERCNARNNCMNNLRINAFDKQIYSTRYTSH
jgi:hypothetical protein